MNWDAIAAFVEGIGALAVIGSLVYVASQIRLANRISVREARAELVDTIQGIYRLPLEHPHLAELNVKLESRDAIFTREEGDQVRALASLWITFLSKVNGTYESGLLPEKVFKVYLSNFSSQLRRQPGFISFLVEAYEQSSIRPGDFEAHDHIFALMTEF